MLDLSPIYDLIARISPWECLQARFMQQALIALVLLAPACAAMGTQVVNCRMAFFSDAISHSAFAGVALGLLVGIDVRWSMLAFGMLVGVGIMAAGRRANLSTDTVIGVVFAGVIAFGLAIVSRDRSVARDVQQFLYGDILTLDDAEIAGLAGLSVLIMAFQCFAYNRLLYAGLHPSLAAAHGVRVAAYQFTFAALLSAVVIFSVWAVGVLLVTALLVVPAAAARNLARSAGAMFWWAILIGLTSAVAGLIISAQSWARTATGATIILCAVAWFIFSLFVSLWRSRG
ncbi:MAG: metal ABC transporter permease [Candidatus Sumerlaeota bacterium]|nr:metal ABC transporter permease [Candidatus Sumerlaeota bacterium]